MFSSYGEVGVVFSSVTRASSASMTVLPMAVTANGCDQNILRLLYTAKYASHATAIRTLVTHTHTHTHTHAHTRTHTHTRCDENPHSNQETGFKHPITIYVCAGINGDLLT
jgi:hypothetical protein